MKDRIIEGLLKDFALEYQLDEKDDADLFEHFVNYCVISRVESESFDLNTVRVAGGGDTGIDGIAIIVNDHIVKSIEDVDYFRKILNRLEVQFIFIQSKTSDKFDMGEIGNFLFGVREFFNGDPRIKRNARITSMRNIKDYIYTQTKYIIEEPPVCHLYYATTGKWENDQNITGRVDVELKYLKDTGLFGDVLFRALDAEAIKNIYRSLKNLIAKEINFERHTIIPVIENVQEAYIGILPCKEYVKFISDSEGALQKSLFYDNVRDFQGNNPVNSEIAETAKSPQQNDRFVLFNNGITIVAKSLHKIGSTFRLKDYQIVNGCQTSHILYQNQNYLNDRMYLPIKLIVTENTEVTNAIIKATNRQTAVTLEAFESLSKFHKALEDFYNSFEKEKEKRLFYERRSKQYDGQPIPRHLIFSVAGQIYTVLSFFFNEPHSTHRYYGELWKAYKSRIFQEDHSPYPYYTSAFAMHILEEYFSRRVVDPVIKQYKYHLIMLMRVLIAGADFPQFNSRKINSYCQKLLETLWNRQKSYAIVEKAIEVLSKTLQESEYGDESERRRAFTDDLLADAISAPVAEKRRMKGKVVQIKGSIAFIYCENKHYIISLKPDEYKTLRVGLVVEFTPDGINAESVKVTS
jgi:hypothetical protein